MAKKLHKSHSNFTLKRLHQIGSYGNIYERDHTTINSMDRLIDGHIPMYGSPTFKVIVRAGVNSKKKYNYGKWLTEEGWTINTLPKIKTKIDSVKVKPNRSKISDYACYGSALKLLEGSVANIVSNFPGELYFTGKDIEVKISEEKTISGILIDNPFVIDIFNQINANRGQINPIRNFYTSFDRYCVIEPLNGVSKDVITWNVTPKGNENCYQDGDLISEVEINGILISVYYFDDNTVYLYSDHKYDGYSIRPNSEYTDSFFESLDDFEKVILNKETDYTCVFETIVETDYGHMMVENTYKWPKSNGWNISIEGISYNEYIEDMINLVSSYDEFMSDNIVGRMVHDSIKNMDNTCYLNDEDGETPEYSEKIVSFLRVFGRQIDDIKRYADSIKRTNRITFDQNGNVPDYFLSNSLGNEGWETKTLFETVDDTVRTEPLYPTNVIGFSQKDVSDEFMRRLKIVSRYIMSCKGTKKSLETVMALFGYRSSDFYRKTGICKPECMFEMDEYDMITEGYNGYEDAEEIKLLNSLKDTFEKEDESVNPNENDYFRLPIASMNYGGKEYIIPWFDKTQEYDGDLYFQSKGNWPEKTVSQIYFSETFNSLLELNGSNIDKDMLYYVHDENRYYRIIDEDNYNFKESWELADKSTVDYNESIIDNNKGNNPHNGKYDNGEEYETIYSNIFRNSTFEKNILTESQHETVTKAGFKTKIVSDNKKCHFFGNVNDVDYFKKTDLRNSDLVPHNLIDGKNGIFDELSSVSVMNDKRFVVRFCEKSKDFIEKYVKFYINQIIPSTTVLNYEYKNFTECK